MIPKTDLRQDLAQLLDRLYGLCFRPGDLDAFMDLIHLHAPVKVPVDVDVVTLQARVAALEAENQHLRSERDVLFAPLIAGDPSRWMKWCDLKALEEVERLKAENQQLKEDNARITQILLR